MAKVSRFAAAFSLGAKVEGPKDETEEDRKSRRAEEKAKKKNESDEDYAKRCEDLDAKWAAEDEKREKGDPDDDDDKTKTAAPDESEDCKKARGEGIVAGALAECNRWGAVLSDKRCADKGVLACHLLSETKLSAEDICQSLAVMPAGVPPTTGLAHRMAASEAAKVVPPAPGTPETVKAGSPEHTASLIAAAAAKARNEKAA